MFKSRQIWLSLHLIIFVMIGFIFVMLLLLPAELHNRMNFVLQNSYWMKQHPHLGIEYLQNATPILLPDCNALLAGNEDEIIFTQEMLYKEVRHQIRDGDYAVMTQNCINFVTQRQYPMEPFSKEEAKYPLAYILTVHKNAEQVERLLRAIYSPQNVYCLHVDENSPHTLQEALSSIAECFPNVFIVSEAVSVVYAGFSRLEADIKCMHDLISSPIKWNYLINLCGQDFPLKTNMEIIRYLKSLKGKNDIPGVIPPKDDQNLLRRFQYSHVVTSTRGINQVTMTKYRKSPPPHNLTIHFGNAYNFFKREFVEYALKNKIACELLEWMRDVYSPDEYYWATLQFIPGVPGGQSVPTWNSAARSIKWRFFVPQKYPPCGGFYQREICVYGVRDLNWLYLQDHMIANKFDLNFDHVVIQCLEVYLKDKVIQQVMPLRGSIDIKTPDDTFSVLMNKSH